MSHREKDGDYDRVIAQLGANWRVIECCDGIQWIVQRKVATRWVSRKFLTSRDGVLRRVGPGLANVDPTAARTGLPGWEALRSLPERFAAGARV